MKKKPSVLDMVKSFAKEVTKYAKEGAPNVTKASYKKRLDTCDSCEHLKRGSMRCGLCGCLVEHKAKWATANCPDRRWAKEVVDRRKKLSLNKEKVVAKRRRNGSQGNSTKASD